MAGKVTFNEPTYAQLVAMGDGLLKVGEADMASQVYTAAMRRTQGPGPQRALRMRLGIAARPNMANLHLSLLHRLEDENASSVFVGAGLATWWKTLPFMEDARFVELSDRHAGLLPIANWQWNLQTALWAVQQAKGVPGDFVELGVFRGHTTLFCAEYVAFQDWPKRWWLYDTFEGIPDDQVVPGWERSNKSLYDGTFSYDEVKQRFAEFPNIDVIQGRVPEVLERGSPDAIAFMHIDMNNPTAEIGALDALFERVSSGGLILFDDFCWVTARAQFDAETKWFAERGLQVLPLPTGQGLFVKR